jgi:hypothetical protein
MINRLERLGLLPQWFVPEGTVIIDPPNNLRNSIIRYYGKEPPYAVLFEQDQMLGCLAGLDEE